MRLVAFIAILVTTCFSVQFSYQGHKIVSVPINSAQDSATILSLPGDVDVLSTELVVGREALVRLSPEAFAALLVANILHTVLVPDLQTYIDEIDSRPHYIENSTAGLSDEWFHTFHDYSDIVAKMWEIHHRFGHHHIINGLVEVIPRIGGRTYEGRDIVGLRIGRGIPGLNHATVLMSGTHAREWISEAVAMWSTEQLLEDYENGDPEVRDLLDHTIYYVIPCYNPDGYMFSRNTQRFWRKNRRDNGNGTFGVDLNRNWDDHWGMYGTSKNPRSTEYCGPSAFSEPETQAMSQFLQGLSRVRSVVDLHSPSQEILRPYGWTNASSPDEARHIVEGDRMVELIQAVHNKTYASIRAIDLYIHSGIALDWVYAQGIAKTSITIELSGPDFVVPASDIQTQGEEFYPVVKYLLSLARHHQD